MSGPDVAADRTSGDHLRIRLGPSTEDLLVAVDLAEREKACCEFFQFSIELGPDVRWLVMGVPPEAIGVLDDIGGTSLRRLLTDQPSVG